ncbi:MAG TPA: S41 family peptidase [Solirubrobacteraceae bacterium]|jgi:carboxyl-terminal processing protease|nr:S41 family peptidase [Solirubrobacteraceae bacterium]
MPQLRRQPLASALALVMALLLLAVGIWLGGHPEHLPSFLHSGFEANHQTEVVDEAIQRISSDYYRKIPAGKLANASISGLVASLGDRFSHYLTPSEYREFDAPPHFTGIGVSITPETVVGRGLLIAHVFDSSPAAHAGLKTGELIVAANGHKLKGLSQEAATALIKGLPGTNVSLEIEGPPSTHASKTSKRTLTITRATISEPVVASTTKVVHGIKLGVLALATFSPGAHGEVREGVEHELHKGVRGIVFDLRSNGGGLVEEAQLIASIFIAKGTIVSTRGRTQPSQTLTATGDAIPSDIPVVVLVDSNTASAAEIVTAALQDHRRATVVGTHTFGKGVFQDEQGLSNGGALDITVGEYFTPDGRNLGGGGVKQGAGITPEVLVPKGVDSEHGLNVALHTLAEKVR